MLHQDNLETRKLLETKFEAIEKGLDRLHDDLVTVHKDLLDIRADLKTLTETVRETNRKLDKIDDRLSDVYTGLVEMRNDMNVGFAQTNKNLEALTREVKVGFETTHDLQRQQLEVSGQILSQTTNMSAIMQDGFGQIVRNQEIQQVLTRDTISTMKKGFGDLRTGQDRQIAIAECNLRISGDIAKAQLQSLNALAASRKDAGGRLSALKRTMQVGYNKIGQGIWSSSGAANHENRETLTRIVTVSNGPRTILGRFLGEICRPVASFVPFAGPMIQRGVERLGDKIQDVGTEIASRELMKISPEAHRITKDLLAGSWAQKKNALFSAASHLAGKAGISTEYVDMISNCVSDEDFEQIAGTIAQKLGVNPDALLFSANHI